MSHQFVQNKACGYFPCHEVDEEVFNCLFCYCPLYPLKENCGGDFVYLDSGIKSCKNCQKPHTKEGYLHVSSKIKQVIELGRK